MAILTNEEREIVLAAVKRAGDFALSHWVGGEEKLPFKVEKKSDGSPVTTVDVAVNEMLVNDLSKTFPKSGFYTEEAAPSENVHEAEMVWVIDPIDGTRYFIDGKKEFSVFAALIKDNEAVFGAAYFPALDCFLWGEKGKGSFLNDEKLSVSTTAELMPGKIYVRNGEISDKKYLFPEEVGTAHGLFYLCRGKVDGLLVQITQHNEWDIAPWIVIVEEAGGKVTDENGGNINFYFGPLGYTKLLVSNGNIHNLLITLVE